MKIISILLFALTYFISPAKAQAINFDPVKNSSKNNFDGFHIGFDGGVFYNSKSGNIAQLLGASVMWRERRDKMTLGFELRYNHLFSEKEKARFQADFQLGFLVSDKILISGALGLVHRPDYRTSLPDASYYIDYKVGLLGEIYVSEKLIAKMGYNMVFDKLGNGTNHYMSIGILLQY